MSMKKTQEITDEQPLFVPVSTLSELRELSLSCQAVASCRVLPLESDLQLQAVGRAASRALPEDLSDKLYDLDAREKAIRSELAVEIQKQDLPEEIQNKQYAKALGANAEIREIRTLAVELWREKVPFAPRTVSVPLDRLPLDTDGKFIMPETATVAYRGENYTVDPYTALLDLVADGIILLGE